MKKALAAIGAFVAIASCTAAATPTAPIAAVAPPPAAAALPSEAVIAPAYYAAAIACDVRVRNTRNGVEISAFAHADEPFRGDYEFVVTKRGASGESDIVQGGPLSFRAGQGERIGVAEISLQRRESFRARLVVDGANGETCRDAVRG